MYENIVQKDMNKFYENWTNVCQNANAPKKIFKPIVGGARWMIFFRSLSCDVVTTNLLRSKRCVKIN